MTQSSVKLYERADLLLVCAIMLAGLILRCLAARGGLWTDEAWSMVYAEQAGDALGVLTRINHDNNHHLNSLWLQLIGPEAPPIWLRGLSILTSSATIGIAALIGFRRNRAAGVMTAALFALSPIMVIYGSEARGYAPMLLALMIMIWRIEIWLGDQSKARPAMLLALCALLGSFAHLMMLPAVVMLGVWVFLSGMQSHGLLKSAKLTADLLGLAMAAAILSICAVIMIAAQSATGLQVGGYIPFAWPLFGSALGELLTLSTGIGYAAQPTIWAVMAIMAIGAMMGFTRWPMPVERKWFYAVLILTMPILVAVLHPGNSQYARYYLPAAVAILLLVGEWIGHLAIRNSISKIVASALLTLMLGLALMQNYHLIASQRGHPEQAVKAMMRNAPDGGVVTIGFERARATLAVAAKRERYPMRIMQGACGAASFHFVTRSAGEPARATPQGCNPAMRLVASGNAIGPSGESWSLYHQQALPRPMAAVSSPLPGSNRHCQTPERA
jgi:hypothetical protein